MSTGAKPKLAVWKFTSCDGCQLSLLDCENELLTIAHAVEIARGVKDMLVRKKIAVRSFLAGAA